jgi:hypothetical protein
MHDILGHARLVQQSDRERRDQRREFRRFRTANAATSGVNSAGFAITQLPATSAAVTWPMKIASGKFQGLMHANTPRPRRLSWFSSPVGPGITIGSANCARAWAA